MMWVRQIQKGRQKNSISNTGVCRNKRCFNILIIIILLTFSLSNALAKTIAAKVNKAEALLDAWQLEDAQQEAANILAKYPQHPKALRLAALVQHARGEHMAALSLLQAAADQSIDDIYPLIKASATYAAAFQTIETDHFKIKYLNKDEIMAYYAAPVLEAAYQGIGKALQFFPAERNQKIVVEIYPDARALADATGLTIREIATSGTIAICKFHRIMVTSALATADGYDWADTIAHEFVHLVISKKSHNTIPIWLHEGIAKYFESGWRGKLGEDLSPYSEKLLADAVRKNKFISFQQMYPSMAKLPSQESVALAFAEVFTTIEYMVHKRGTAAIAKILSFAANGSKLETVLRRVFGVGLSGIETAWKKYLMRRPFREIAGSKPHLIRLATDEKQATETKPLEEIKEQEVHDLARLGELLILRGHTKAALTEYEKAYAKSGVTYATLVYRLARIYLDNNREQKALKLLNKAITIHGNEVDLRLLAGRARLASKDYAAAYQDFDAVRLQNPFIPELHKSLQEIYIAKGDEIDAKREARFYELSIKPRPIRVYKLPTRANGTAELNIITVPFNDVKVDGITYAAPQWSIPVTEGEHNIEMVLANGKSVAQRIKFTAGEKRTVILQ
ncbi:MAG: hypothetical protein JW841_00565 [Deltaproteobacteria bacterium]|nr:hypothetical protein [Deltaproteobacteria bacterium]